MAESGAPSATASEFAPSELPLSEPGEVSPTPAGGGKYPPYASTVPPTNHTHSNASVIVSPTPAAGGKYPPYASTVPPTNHTHSNASVIVSPTPAGGSKYPPYASTVPPTNHTHSNASVIDSPTPAGGGKYPPYASTVPPTNHTHSNASVIVSPTPAGGGKYPPYASTVPPTNHTHSNASVIVSPTPAGGGKYPPYASTVPPTNHTHSNASVIVSPTPAFGGGGGKSYPPYPPYASTRAPPSVADTIIAGRDMRLHHKSVSRQPVRPPPKPAKPRGPKATDVKMTKRSTRAHARCLRRHGAVLTDRLERMAKPQRRNILCLWREHACHLPPETIARLRAMLDADEPFKPDQAYEYFVNLRRTKKKTTTTAKVNQIKKDVMAIYTDKRFMWARNATVAFARGIQQRLSRPGRYALADRMLRLSNIVLDEICCYQKMRPPSRRNTHPKAKFMLEMADKIAVWIDEVLEESSDRMLMMDFDEDEEIRQSKADAERKAKEAAAMTPSEATPGGSPSATPGDTPALSGSPTSATPAETPAATPGDTTAATPTPAQTPGSSKTNLPSSQ